MAGSVICYITASLDGFIADEAGGVDWLRGAEGEDYGYARFYARIGAVLMGSRTYEQVIGFDIDFPYADKPCYVFTSRSDLPKAAETVQFIAEDPVAFVRSLAERSDQTLWACGGSQLVTALWDAGLIDELDLFVQPVVLGSGIPLLGDGHVRSDLKLLAARGVPGDLVELRYAVEHG